MQTKPLTRQLKYFQAINEATDLCMAQDPRVYVMGLGVPDPKGIFGTTLGHDMKTGADPDYHKLLAYGLLWACDKLGADGKPLPGYEGTVGK